MVPGRNNSASSFEASAVKQEPDGGSLAKLGETIRILISDDYLSRVYKLHKPKLINASLTECTRVTIKNTF